MRVAPSPTAEDLRERFERPASFSLGLEEELMLLDPETFDLAPVAEQALERVGADARFKPEMPAAQIELITPPAPTVAAAAQQLADARRDLAQALDGLARLAGSGTHPFGAPAGALNRAERYDAMLAEFGDVARLQLVFGLHVHIGIGGADRVLAVHNALRGHLPDIAALAANAPFHAGRDTGLQSVRPKLSGLLPRQGVPPALASFEELAETYAWGARGRFAARQWWWEARLHPVHGTIEVRVPDTQITASDTLAVAGVVHALVHHLSAAYDAGESLACHPSWRIDENRWSALSRGTEGRMADLETGRLEPTRDRLERLLDGLGPSARALDAEPAVAAAGRLLDDGGAARQRAVAADSGLRGLTAWLADAFAPPSRLLPENGRVRTTP